MSNTPAFLNKFPAQAVPTPQGDAGNGFIREAPLDMGLTPGPVMPPPGLTGPIHMQSGWHTGPGVSVTNVGQDTYGAQSPYGVPDGHPEQATYSTDDIISAQAQMEAEKRAYEMLAEAEAASVAAQQAADAASERVQAAAPGLLPRMAGYAAITALGYAAGRKFAPAMPIKAIRGSVPVAGALTGAGVATAFYKDYDQSLMKGGALLLAMIGGVYVMDVLYSKAYK
jgi:hypothetical protein